MPNINCDVCSSEVVAEDVESTDEYEAVCKPCMLTFYTCVDCHCLTNDADYTTCTHGKVCSDCYSNGDYSECDCCGNIINLSNETSYCDSENTGNYACENCGDEELSSCDCGSSILWNEVGSDGYYEGLCDNCHNRPEQSISRLTVGGNSILRADIETLKSYKSMAAQTAEFADWFYRGEENNYEHINVEIAKGALGVYAGTNVEPEETPNWWLGKLSIQSNVYKDTANIIYRLMTSNTFLTEHKKYGLYHPLRHMFSKHISYRRISDSSSENIQGVDVSLQEQGEDYFRFVVDFINKRGIGDQLASNKTNEGADLRRALNLIFNRAYKIRLPQWIAGLRDRATEEHWRTTLQHYNTNATNVKLDVMIGYENNIDFSKEVERFNHKCNSCQVASNRESYGFGYMDMFVNPHLYAFIKNSDGVIIGRSIIRLFKRNNDSWDDADSPVFVAPSRLYLTEHTNSKSDVYVALFEAVDKWAESTFVNHKLIAYRGSRHDSSVRSIISNHPHKIGFDTDANQTNLVTQKWLPYWRTKPMSDECSYTYYRDEDQIPRHYEVSDSSSFETEYAVEELLYSDSYAIVEIKND